jgi:3-phosphoshikimate 1-carboxyvinyltransferase
LAAIRSAVDADDESALAALAEALDLAFEQGSVRLDGVDVSALLRHESIGTLASRISALPAVRQALLRLQWSFRRLPGLVADGRDMGTVIFPDAPLKIYLTASADARARRRHQQLEAAGVSTTLESLLVGLQERDARDQNRTASPLKPAADAVLLDNSALSIESTVDAVLSYWSQRTPLA